MIFAKRFNCVNSGHKVINCKAKPGCNNCNDKHHVSNCSRALIKNWPKQKVSEPLSSSTALIAPTAIALALDPTVTSWVGSIQPKGKVALQLALTLVNDKMATLFINR